MWTINSEQIARNGGWYAPEEQQAVLDSRVSIVGVGGAGFPLGISLVRAGVQEFVVGDPDTIGVSNFNRHPGAFVDTLGMNKAQVFADTVHRINPDANVTIYTEGMTADNVDDFADADLVFDGIDFNLPWLSVMLHRAARDRGNTTMTGVELGSSAVLTSFNRNTKTFEEMMGFKPSTSLSEIEDKSHDGPDLAASLAYLPFKSSQLSALKAVQDGAPLPSTVEGVELFGAATAHEAFLHLTSKVGNTNESHWSNLKRHTIGRGLMGNNRKAPIWAPDYMVYDLERRRANVIHQSSLRTYGYIALLALRSKAGLNPSVNYDDALQREQARSAE